MKLNIYTEIYTLKNAHLDDLHKNKYGNISTAFFLNQKSQTDRQTQETLQILD